MAWKIDTDIRLINDGTVVNIKAGSSTACIMAMMSEMAWGLPYKDVRKHYLEWKLQQWDASKSETHDIPEYQELMEEWINSGYPYWYTAFRTTPTVGWIEIEEDDPGRTASHVEDDACAVYDPTP